ncbi:cupin domain-containing protein [Streptomyces sp. NPDC054813]
MIISTTAEAVRTSVDTDSGADATAAWTCLVRRGMLHSECEAVEHWSLPRGAVLTADPRHGVEEALLVLEGEPRLVTASGERALRAGQLALIPHGCRARLVADRDAVRLISVRTLAASVTDRLPPRIPELVPS